MLETLATLSLGAVMTAFAIFAVMLNEGERSTRLRKDRGRRRGSSDTLGDERPEEPYSPISSASAVLPGDEPVPTGAPVGRGDQRRLAVGDLLFGALFLRGTTPLAFADLAQTAGESGLDVSQVLSWLARAEEGGLIERVDDVSVEGQPSTHPAVRLTPAGMELAQNNRRGGDRGERPVGADRAFHRAT